MESDDEEYEDTMQEEVDEEEEGANEDDIYSYDQEEMEVEAEVIVGDNEQEERSKAEKMKTYRLIKATNDQIKSSIRRDQASKRCSGNASRLCRNYKT